VTQERVDFDAFLRDALRCGVTVESFWSMTPRETYATIEAAAWRAEQEQKARAWLAWHTAALSRAKRMPPLARLLPLPAARPLSKEDAAKKRSEFEAMASTNVERINEWALDKLGRRKK
jgi:hypothetical protein